MATALSWEKIDNSDQKTRIASGHCVCFEIKGHYSLTLIDHDLTISCLTMKQSVKLADRINKMGIMDTYIFIKWRKFTRALVTGKRYVLSLIRKVIN